MNANGKIDRRALPSPPTTRPELEVPFVAPRGAIEETLAALWSDLLNVETVGVHDSFFEFGGDSLLALRFTAQVRDAFDVEVSLPEFYGGATVAQVARLVEASLIGRVRAGRDSDGDRERPPMLPRLQHDAGHRYEPFPLTETQQALWIGRGDAVELGNVGCYTYVEREQVGLDLDRFRLAWQRLVERHDMLRAIIRPDGRQQVLPIAPPYELKVLDLRGQDSTRVEEELVRLRDEMSHQVPPADRWPLFDVRATLLDNDRTRLHIGVDLLIMDAWSWYQILFPELERLYDDPDVGLPPLEITFRDYVLGTEADLENSEAYRSSCDYWLRRLPTLPPAPDLPRATVPSSATRPRFWRRAHSLEPARWSRLKARSQQARVTPTAILVAVYAEVLRTWSANDQFTINFPIFNRPPLHPQIEHVLGDFTNMLLVAAEKSDGTFEERARSIQQQLWSDVENRHFSGVRALRELARLHGGSVRAAMPIVVGSLLGQPPRSELSALGREIYGITQTPQVLLDFQIREVKGSLHFNWDALEAMFPTGMLDAMFSAYTGLLDRLIDHEASWELERFQLVPESQLAQRAAINATEASVPEALLHELVAERAHQLSGELAVIASHSQLTFSDLCRRANQVGRRLRELGARRNKPIAIVMEKGWEQYAAVYGILVSGAPYLPLEPGVPRERLWYLLENGEVDIVLTQSWLDERLSWPPLIRRLCVDRDFDSVDDSPLASIQEPSDLAYVIYTSGSTGKPKGVMVDHRAVLNTILDINRRFGIGVSDRAFAISPLSFDASVYDVFGPLVAGGSVVLPDPAPQPDPAHWTDLIVGKCVTFWNSVPALMEILVGHLEGRSNRPLRSLRVVILSGDWIPVSLPDRLRALGEDILVVSAGGPTETIVWSVIFPIDVVDPNWTGIPYGRPMTNQHYYILDPRLEPRPVWVPGQMYVGSSVGLAKGYWRDEELTRSRFLVLPETGERIYATGDIGRFLPDGNLEILGREDLQVKIQGHRIELGEIEAALAEHPDICAAVVVAPKAVDGNRRLAAFATTAPALSEPPSTDELRRFLQEKLPGSMVPSRFTILDEFPLSPNGKVDRLKLSQLDAQHESGEASGFVAPRTPLEMVMASLCSDVLGVERVGVYDNFFVLGGNSLSGTRLAGRIRELLEVDLPLRTLFARPTLADFCAALVSESGEGERVLATAEVLAQLSTEEVDRILQEVRGEGG
jgi:amino acid adenylation domain-containing protein